MIKIFKILGYIIFGQSRPISLSRMGGQNIWDAPQCFEVMLRRSSYRMAKVQNSFF